MGIGAGGAAHAGRGEDRLELRLLGELQLLWAGKELALPASKKTRALLAYLVATGASHRRESLCDLLWEGPDDPRGELRWSLAKIRPLLDAGGTVRLRTDRSGVVFEPRAATIDLARVRALLADLAGAAVPMLEAGLGLFRGEFLDGLDLPTCYRFQAWCLAERAAASALRLGALRALVARLDDDPEAALVHARTLVAADPLSEQGHACVVRLLARLGRRREAIAQYEQARLMLERETGVPLSGALESARYAIAPRAGGPDPPSREAARSPGALATERTRPIPPLVGRQAERDEIDWLVSAAANRGPIPLLLVTGEPGIGKTRLLDHLAARVAMLGGRGLKGRAFEAEAGHPYGAWIEALRAVPPEVVAEPTRRSLALLRPEFGPPPPIPIDRVRLFEAVLALLRHLASDAPLAVVLDDVQWLDEPSTALLHYVARMPNAPEGVLLACAARTGELDDNPALARALRALERDGRLLARPLGPLTEAETAELVRALDPTADAAAVFAESDGNPLFAIEVSRRSGGGHQPGHPLRAVIEGQLAALDEPCRSLAGWAAALGRAFDPFLLGHLTGGGTVAHLSALERLERHGIVRPLGTDRYDFVHDLVRRAAYQALSQPRRTLMHRRIARVLEARVTADDTVAGDLVRHAELAGDHALAARACILAGERSLRLFANAEAAALARRGRAHLDRLADGALRCELMIGILKVEVLSASGPGLRPPPTAAAEVAEAVAHAEVHGLAAAAATGHFLLSVLHQHAGDTPRALDSTVRAAELGRDADRRTQARQLANTARCLFELETGIPRARALLDDAEAALGPLGTTECELQWGRGLAERWAGHLDRAAHRIARALDLARTAQDRWRESKCLAWLAAIAFERQLYDEARERCRDLRHVAERMGEEGAPLADAIEALAGAAGESAAGLAEVDAALARLRSVDDKSHLAYTLNAAALLALRRGRLVRAETYAAEARRTADAMRRCNDIAIAELLLAQIHAGGAGSGPDRRIERLRQQLADSGRFSARVRAWAGDAADLAIACATSARAVRGAKRGAERGAGS